MKFTATVKLDSETGEHMIELPDELIEEVGWCVGDNIKWMSNGNGSFILSKTLYKWEQLELFSL